MRPVTFLAFIIFGMSSFHAHGRAYKDTEGRAIEAEIDSISGANVKLKLPGGKLATVNLAKLSAEDRAYCEKWRAENPQVKLSIGATSFSRLVEKKRTAHLSSEVNDSGYRITVSNWTSDPNAPALEGVTAKYTLYVRLVDKNADGKPWIVSKSFECTVNPLRGAKAVSFDTDTLRVTKAVHRDYRTTTSNGETTTRIVITQDTEESVVGLDVTFLLDGKKVGAFTKGRTK